MKNVKKKLNLKEKSDEDLINEIMRNYIKVYAAGRRRAARLTDRFGITMLQFTTLHVIKNGKSPIYLSDISERIFLHQSTITGLIDRMERDGLVARERSKKDRRKIAVGLTTKGKKLAEAIPFSPMEMFKELLRPLNRTEREILLELLFKVSEPLMRTFEAIDQYEKEEQKGKKREV